MSFCITTPIQPHFLSLQFPKHFNLSLLNNALHKDFSGVDASQTLLDFVFPTQQNISDGFGRVGNDVPLIKPATFELDHDVESGRTCSSHTPCIFLPRPGHLFLDSPRLFGDVVGRRLFRRFQSSEEVPQVLVLDEAPQVSYTSGGDQAHPTVPAHPDGLHLFLLADLVDDHDGRGVVLEALDYGFGLARRGLDHHPPGVADAGMGDVAVPGYFVRGVDNEDVAHSRKDLGRVPHNRRLAASALAEK
mmetsp:Transcript_33517/g.71433  ORF Transcript_33517/g.71433 Transcript_33517/m.71433 type:complete len:247 (+) Transcript_33517:38-778(+)